MKQIEPITSRVGIILCALLLATLFGCVGYVGPGGGPVGIYAPGPDIHVFGGYDRGGYDRDAGHRGAVSRQASGHNRR